MNRAAISIITVIPGVFYSPSGNNCHAFIQFSDGSEAGYRFYVYPLQEFYASPHEFYIKIAHNEFCQEYINLLFDQGQPAGLEIQGELTPAGKYQN